MVRQYPKIGRRITDNGREFPSAMSGLKQALLFIFYSKRKENKRKIKTLIKIDKRKAEKDKNIPNKNIKQIAFNFFTKMFAFFGVRG